MTLKRRTWLICFTIENLFDYFPIYLRLLNSIQKMESNFMKTVKIIQVEVNFQHELVPIKGSESTFSYYSNLSIAHKAILNSLVLNGWELTGFNYTAVYRALRSKESYVKVFKAKGTPFFKISISFKNLNPKLDMFELVKNPT